MPITGQTYTGARNSFLTFFGRNQQLYPLDICSLDINFCFPFYQSGDVRFQFTLNTPYLPADYEDTGQLRFYTETDAGLLQINGVTWTATQTALGKVLLDVNFQGSDIAQTYIDGTCFTIRIQTGNQAPAPTILPFEFWNSDQCFVRITNPCNTLKLIYYNQDDAFGFIYPGQNAIRLPIYFKDTEIEIDQKVYLRSDGSRQRIKSRLSRKFKALVDVMPEQAHKALIVALNHDSVNVVFPNGLGTFISFDNEYTSLFPSSTTVINGYPAEFIAYETPFDELNTNC